MKALIESYAENIVIDPLVAIIHFDGSTEIKEYFKKHKLTSNVLFSNTLATQREERKNENAENERPG